MDGSFATKLLNTIEQDWQESLAHGFLQSFFFKILCLMAHVPNLEWTKDFMFDDACSKCRDFINWETWFHV